MKGRPPFGCALKVAQKAEAGFLSCALEVSRDGAGLVAQVRSAVPFAWWGDELLWVPLGGGSAFEEQLEPLSRGVRGEEDPEDVEIRCMGAVGGAAKLEAQRGTEGEPPLGEGCAWEGGIVL